MEELGSASTGAGENAIIGREVTEEEEDEMEVDVRLNRRELELLLEALAVIVAKHPDHDDRYDLGMLAGKLTRCWIETGPSKEDVDVRLWR